MNTDNHLPTSNHLFLENTQLPGLEELHNFTSDPDFIPKMRQAFGDSWQIEAAQSLVGDIVSGREFPGIEVVPGSYFDENADAAFGADTIYFAEEFIEDNLTNYRAMSNAVLEEMGHYIDSKLNIEDSPGDEGAIFAALVQDKHLSESQLIELKAEDDSGLIDFGNATIPVEYSLQQTGVFTVNATGEFNIDFLFDAGVFNSEVAIFSLTGMEGLTPGSIEYIREAASRALSNSEMGYITIRDSSEGAKLFGELGESDRNSGDYSGVKNLRMKPGDKFALMLVPQGTIQEVFDNPGAGGVKRPLFSISSANPGNAAQMMQLVSGSTDGGVFGVEDMRVDGSSDRDYNDVIFQIKGAVGKLNSLNDVISPNERWDLNPLGQQIIDVGVANNSFERGSTEITASLVNDGGLSATDNITPDPQIQGMVTNINQVPQLTARFEGKPDVIDLSTNLQSDGKFSLSQDELSKINGGSLPNGIYNLVLEARDSIGEVFSSTTFKFTFDTIAPNPPINLGLSKAKGTFLKDNTPIIAGEAEAGTKIEIFDNGVLVGEGTSNGTWEIETSVELADGTKNITAKATDAAGNMSMMSQPLTFNIDTALPQLKINSPAENANLVPGARLQGSVDGTGSPIVEVTYRFGENENVGEKPVQVNPNGEFDIPLDLAGIPQGAGKITITTKDVAGNTQSVTIGVNIKNEPVVNVTLVEDTGVLNNDRITSNPAIRGIISNSQNIVNIRAGFNDTPEDKFTNVQSDLNKEDGTFSFDINRIRQINGNNPLKEGENTFNIIATDLSGNTSEKLELKFTLDTTAPSAEIKVEPPSDTSVPSSLLNINFNEAVSRESFNAGNYALKIVGGANDGQSIAIRTASKVNDNQARLELEKVLGKENYQLTLGNGIKDLAGNSIPDSTLVKFSLLDPDTEGENPNPSPIPQTAEIKGGAWNDINGDGVRNPEESSLSGWTVYLDTNKNGQLDSGETSTTTGGNGEYVFKNLAPGSYDIAYVPQLGWENTAQTDILIPVADRRDLIFSKQKNQLFITTSGGNIERYDIAQRQSLPAFDVGSSLNGGDITTDGNFLYVAEEQRGATQGFIRKVNTSDGTVTNIRYNLERNEGGAWDVKIASNGKALVTTDFEGSGWTPLRELKLSDDTLSQPTNAAGSSGNEVRQNTDIARSTNRNLLFLTEANISSGPIFTYDALTDTYPSQSNTNTFLGKGSAVNKDGSLVALQLGSSISILDKGLQSVENLSNLNGGFAFDPVKDLFYAANSSTDELITYDSKTWKELSRRKVDEDIKESESFFTFNRPMSVSDDGKYIFLSTPSGVRMLNATKKDSYMVKVGEGEVVENINFGSRQNRAVIL
ncbi:MAG: Ig-like domain-containing protein [Cyanobacteria bacterium P01_A01_bin.84]